MKLPKDWSEVTIGTFYKYHAAIKGHKPDEIPTETEIKILSALSGEDFKVIEALKVSEIKKLISEVAFIGTLPSKRLPLDFELDGKKWKALIFQTEMSGGQFIDYASISERVKRDKEDIVYSMHEFIACFCIPADDTGEFTYHGYQSNAEVIHDKMTIDRAYPFFVFFSNVWTKLSPRIQHYFRKKSIKNLNYLKKEIKKLYSR